MGCGRAIGGKAGRKEDEEEEGEEDWNAMKRNGCDKPAVDGHLHTFSMSAKVTID